MNTETLDTPAAVVDLDGLQENINRLQRHLDRHEILNRPHIKTHKIPEIAHMQIRAGAVGITCQKLGEAEVMAQAGIEDIFLPYNILGEAKLERLVNLRRRVKLSVTADSPVTVKGLSGAMATSGNVLPVLVEFDSGLGRCGVQSPQEAAELGSLIARAPGLHFGGLMTYPSNEHLGPFVAETGRLLQVQGLRLERVSGGGSAAAWQVQNQPQVTEHRAGTYVYGDRQGMQQGYASLEQCVFKIVTTMVSRPTTDRGILDAGSKTLSSDLGPLADYGLIIEYPQAQIYALNEEHGYVDFSACEQRPDIGERLTIVPNHVCAVSNLMNEVYGLRGNQVQVVWPVAARGLVG